ncbi:MAG: hypothetical protein J6X25_08860, partial [Bacteroidales bacterium]|nr:hypothetical protein [Bacteroidales bacterium]
KARRMDGKVAFRKEVIRAEQTIGNFTHGPRAPYDPNLLVLGNTLMVYFNGCVGQEVTFCARPYNLRKDTFEDRIIVCKLRYKDSSGTEKTIDLDAKGYYRFLEDAGIKGEYHNDICISSRFVPYRGAWYGVLAGVFTQASKPVVVRTRDGITFDVVMICREFEWGACEACLEIVDDEYYVAMRNAGCQREFQGTYLAKYGPDGRCLVLPRKLGRCQSKPAIISFKKGLYVFYNDYPNLNTEWGNVTRSRLRVEQIDRNCNKVKSWEILSGVGIHYPYVNIYKNHLYISFTEDRKKVDVKQCRSNVSFTEIKI